MGLSSRLFLLGGDDSLHALAGTAFMRMLRQEAVARLPDFAGQRVRSASLIIELADRRPSRVLHLSFSILNFDKDGFLDLARLCARQMARADTVMAEVLRGSASGASVVDAASRFIARGGSWEPDERLMRRIEAAALGQLSSPRVRVVR